MKPLTVSIATATQYSDDSGKSKWFVNSNNEKLWEFSKELDEREMMNIIHFARKYELEAFNKGINFEKEHAPKKIKALESVIEHLKTQNKLLIQENERLGSALDNLLTSKI